MFFNKKLIFIFLLLIFPDIVKSNTYSVSRKFYFGLGGGFISPNDVDINVSTAGAINGVNFSANIDGEFQFDTGYQLSGLIGYRLSDSLSLETELAYTNFDYDKVNLTTAGTATTGGVTFTGAASSSYDIEGSISSFSMIFGPSFDFDFNNKTEFILGGGIGFSSYNDEIEKVGGSTGLSYDVENTDFSAKFKTGINYSIDLVTYIHGEYGYNYVDSGIDNYTDDFTAHSFNAKLMYNF